MSDEPTQLIVILEDDHERIAVLGYGNDCKEPIAGRPIGLLIISYS